MKPFKNTSIRANVEYFLNKNRRPNSVTPRDFVTPWIAAGRPSYNPVTRMLTRGNAVTGPYDGSVGASNDALLAASLNTVQFDGNPRPVLMIEQGRELLYLMRQLSSTPNVAGTPAAFTFNSPIRATKSQGPNLLVNQVTGLPAGLTFAEPGVTDNPSTTGNRSTSSRATSAKTRRSRITSSSSSRSCPTSTSGALVAGPRRRHDRLAR